MSICEPERICAGWGDEVTEQEEDYIGILMSRQNCSLLGCWEQNCIRLAASHTTEHHGGREIARKLNKIKHYRAEISEILTIDYRMIKSIECIYEVNPRTHKNNKPSRPRLTKLRKKSEPRFIYLGLLIKFLHDLMPDYW